MGFQEKILEGKFNFIKDKNTYCEEFFKLFQDSSPQGNYTFNSEILSRVETGEFLKIYVDYELSYQFEPISVRIKRSLGAKKSTERYVINQKDKTVHYSLNSKLGSGEFEKVINNKFHISTPSFASNLAMTQHRKPDPVHRTPYAVITSPNIWKYEAPFIEGMVHVELVNSEPRAIKMRTGHEVQAIHFKLFDEDRLSNPHGQGHDFYLSKYFQIPYKADLLGGISVEIEMLKNFQVDHSYLFK
tara:strand:+ start:98264 stop:98995 length:732 start_codon:yes stop_codon:yes gene_type:complete